MGKHIVVKARPGNPPLVIPEDPRPMRTHKGLMVTTGVKGRGSLVTPTSQGERGEGDNPKGSLKDSKMMRGGKQVITGPAEHVLP